MRNLLEYPVRSDEAITVLQSALKGYTARIGEYGVGNIDGIAMLTIENFIKANSDKFDNFSIDFVTKRHE